MLHHIDIGEMNISTATRYYQVVQRAELTIPKSCKDLEKEKPQKPLSSAVAVNWDCHLAERFDVS